MVSNEMIEAVTKKLVSAYNPITIYLFGSHAWGQPDAGSDLDLLIVIDQSDQKIHRRGDAGAEALWELKVPKDLLIYTKDEFAKTTADSSTLCYKIKKEGKVLYARA
ncbi:MAG: nucleotidyltransferase domain-containing protein [Epsilonproteobacteria bacterium]|nr:nucleotidyltransferase domain-containing protein [Campylobacterota bacterium]